VRPDSALPSTTAWCNRFANKIKTGKRRDMGA
jgi:hypothetical protein